MHVHDHAGGSVHARQLFHRQNRLKELAARATILLRHFDPHQPELKELVDEIFVEDALFVHLLHQRTNFLFGELADVVTKENFVFREAGQRSRRGKLQNIRHESTFR